MPSPTPIPRKLPQAPNEPTRNLYGNRVYCLLFSDSHSNPLGTEMTARAELKTRVKSLFLAPATGDPSILATEAAASSMPAQRPFSVFDLEDQERQAALMFEVFEAFGRPDDPDDGLDAALSLLETAARDGDLMMAQHTLGIFAAHAPKLRDGVTSVPVPPLAFAAVEATAELEPPAAALDDTSPHAGEALLHWWREDIHLNEHHRHWHMVYATSGVPSGPPSQPTLPVRMKARQGEVFVYMHKQMLARYETERVTAGLPNVEAYADFAEPLGVGYDPNVREPVSLGYVERPDGAKLTDANRIDLEARRAAFRDFLQTGQIDGQPVPVTTASVGTALESNRAMTATRFETLAEYQAAGNLVRNLHLHNVGHGAIASAGVVGSGVMTNPHTSLKDPVFWRWHKMIDDLAEDYYATLPPHDFAGAAITVDQELTLLSDTANPAIDFGNEDRDALRATLQAAAEAAFAAGTTGADTLKTGILRERYTYLGRFHGPGVPDRVFDRDTLFCERFAIALRATSPVDTEATARIFISAEDFLDLDPTLPAEDRAAIRATEHRYWIEVDRQPIALTAGQTQVFVFPADQSSIVRKLRGKAIWPTSAITEADFDALHDDALGDRDDYCDCGWPINLLLPMGRTGGMPFRMMAMVSEGAPSVGAGSCGSRSFCGTDFEGYPELDEINMGFPFDRPAPDGTLTLIAASPNMAMRPFNIEHIDDLFSQIQPTS